MSINLSSVSDSTAVTSSASEALGRQTQSQGASTLVAAQSQPTPVQQPVFIEQAPKKPVDFSAQVASNQKALEQALEELNQQASQSKLSVGFSLDKASGMQYVQVTNANSGDVILQYPSSKVLSIAASIDQLKGLLYNKIA
jgi:flagellar protein FlaG